MLDKITSIKLKIYRINLDIRVHYKNSLDNQSAGKIFCYLNLLLLLSRAS